MMKKKKERKKPKHMILALGYLKIENYYFDRQFISLVSSSGIPRLSALLFHFPPARKSFQVVLK